VRRFTPYICHRSAGNPGGASDQTGAVSRLSSAVSAGTFFEAIGSLQVARFLGVGARDISIKASRTLSHTTEGGSRGARAGQEEQCSGAVTLEGSLYAAYAIGGMNRSGRDLGLKDAAADRRSIRLIDGVLFSRL
jgi:hypothetical protein